MRIAPSEPQTRKNAIILPLTFSLSSSAMFLSKFEIQVFKPAPANRRALYTFAPWFKGFSSGFASFFQGRDVSYIPAELLGFQQPTHDLSASGLRQPLREGNLRRYGDAAQHVPHVIL